MGGQVMRKFIPVAEVTGSGYEEMPNCDGDLSSSL
jgi:hypothetical protein